MNQKANEQNCSTPKSTARAALRYNKGKPELSYLLDFPNAISSFAQVAEFDAFACTKHNWKLGRQVSKVIDSLLRHAMQFQNGEDVDKESGCLHSAHMMWDCMVLIETIANHPNMLDDRHTGIAPPPKPNADGPLMPPATPLPIGVTVEKYGLLKDDDPDSVLSF